jgi:hypothetical protein
MASSGGFASAAKVLHLSSTMFCQGNNVMYMVLTGLTSKILSRSRFNAHTLGLYRVLGLLLGTS